MKSVPTPWTHTGRTAEPQAIAFGPSGGRLQHTVTVPAGTECHLLEGHGDQATWVVADLSFIENKRGILYSDADTYGIRVPHDKITGIKPADVEVPGLHHGSKRQHAEMDANDVVPPATPAEAEEAIRELVAQREELLHARYMALPFVEDAAHDPCYKPGHVKKVERHIRGALESVERAMKPPGAPGQG